MWPELRLTLLWPHVEMSVLCCGRILCCLESNAAKKTPAELQSLLTIWRLPHANYQIFQDVLWHSGRCAAAAPALLLWTRRKYLTVLWSPPAGTRQWPCRSSTTPATAPGGGWPWWLQWCGSSPSPSPAHCCLDSTTLVDLHLQYLKSLSFSLQEINEWWGTKLLLKFWQNNNFGPNRICWQGQFGLKKNKQMNWVNYSWICSLNRPPHVPPFFFNAVVSEDWRVTFLLPHWEHIILAAVSQEEHEMLSCVNQAWRRLREERRMGWWVCLILWLTSIINQIVYCRFFHNACTWKVWQQTLKEFLFS